MIIFCLWTSNSCDVYLFELIAALKEDCITWHHPLLQPKRNVSLIDYTSIYLHLFRPMHILHSISVLAILLFLTDTSQWWNLKAWKKGTFYWWRTPLVIAELPAAPWTHAEPVTGCCSAFFFWSALRLLQVLGQHVYNCVLHTKIANSPKGKPPPNWDNQQRSCYFYKFFSSLRPAGFRGRRRLRTCLTTPALEKMRDNFSRMGSSEISARLIVTNDLHSNWAFPVFSLIGDKQSRRFCWLFTMFIAHRVDRKCKAGLCFDCWTSFKHLKHPPALFLFLDKPFIVVKVLCVLSVMMYLSTSCPSQKCVFIHIFLNSRLSCRNKHKLVQWSKLISFKLFLPSCNGPNCWSGFAKS